MNASAIVSKCNYFRQVGLWPAEQELHYEAWLSNFLPGEKEFALALLNKFTFFSDPLTRQLFQATFHGISRDICRSQGNHREASAAWNDFVGQLILTRITGESPNDTDSGYRYVRMARQQLGIREDQIVPPDKALQEWIDTPNRPIVFVDDFLGSGQQFLTTWKRSYALSNGNSTSFHDVAEQITSPKVIYCVPVSTSYGINKIAAEAPLVMVESAHILGPTNSMVGTESKCWPDHLKSGSRDFIISVSRRAGIPDSRHFGFHSLGLAIAFEHCVPDASLPIFYTENSAWKPLRRRN